MAGSKTRFGFAGDGSEPPDGEESRAARTVIGHDIHLRLPTGFVPPRTPESPTPLPPPLAPRVPAPPARVILPEEDTDESVAARRRRRPRTSRLARFLGRWTRSGRFVSNSRLGDEADVDLELPRDTTGRNVILVLLVALFAFGLTFAIVRLRQHFAVQGPDTKEQVSAVAPSPPPGPTPPGPVTTPADPAMSPAQVPTTPSPHPPQPLPAAARGLGPIVPMVPARKPARRPKYGAEPPDHLKGELLPMKP